MNIVIVVGFFITTLTIALVLRQVRGHPRGLYVLFFTEVWERFSYYGMRALLIFYLTQHFMFGDREAQSQYAAYATLALLAPLLGGYVADRYLGTRKAIGFGALLLVAGHLAMAIEGPPATQNILLNGRSWAIVPEGRMADRRVCLELPSGCHALGGVQGGGLKVEDWHASDKLPEILAAGSYSIEVTSPPTAFREIFYLALSLIIVGIGYLKPNISSLVGQLYLPNDPRRDPGFTLYYFGINLGALWAAAICGLVGQTVGWWAGFGLAGLGMLCGLFVFRSGRAHLAGHGEPPSHDALARRVVGPLRLETMLYGAGLVFIVVVWRLVRDFELVGWSLAVAWIAVPTYLGWYMTFRCDRISRHRLILATILIIGSMIFFVLFNQAGSSLNQFAERNVELPSSGFWTITASQTQAFNPGFILIFAPAVAWLWTTLGRTGRDPNPGLKFGLGLIQIGGGFLVLTLGTRFHDEAWRTPLIFLATAYLLHTTGELFLSPVGLSQMAKLAPPAFVSSLFAIWFMASSASEYIGGLVARLTASSTVGGQMLDPAASLANYAMVFRGIGLAGMGAGLVFVFVSPWLARLAHVGEEENWASGTGVGGGSPGPGGSISSRISHGLSPAPLKDENA